MHFVIKYASGELLVSFLFAMMLAWVTTFAVSKLHRRFITLGWLSAWLATSMVVVAVAFEHWQADHPAGTAGHVSASADRLATLAGLGFFLLCAVLTGVFWTAANNVRRGFERKREQRKRNEQIERECEEPFTFGMNGRTWPMPRTPRCLR